MNQKKKPLALGAGFYFFPLWFWLRSNMELEMEVGFKHGMLCNSLPDGRMGIIYLFIYFQQ